MWVVPRQWPGRTVAVFACGQSLTQAVVDEVREAGLPAIGVNDAYRLAPWVDILYAADARWWAHHAEGVRALSAIKVCAQTEVRVEGVVSIKQTGIFGFDAHPARVRTGGNSGYQAVHVAIHTGAARILLFGFDMHGTHFFGRHPAPLRNPDADSLARWVERFAALNGRGAEIINCTPGSALDAFPIEDPFVALEASRAEA